MDDLAFLRPSEYNQNPDKWIGSSPIIDPTKLFDFLVKLVCPIPCVGYVNETGWHKLCEEKAHKAMKELGYE